MSCNWSEAVARRLATCASLALATEPLGRKPGCTTRHEDSSPHAKLAHFIVGGINVIWGFYDLARDTAEGTVQHPVYQYARISQEESIKWRGGGKVTFGQTMLLAPLVALQARDWRSSEEHPPIPAEEQVQSFLSGLQGDEVTELERFCSVALRQSAESHSRHRSSRKQPDTA